MLCCRLSGGHLSFGNYVIADDLGDVGLVKVRCGELLHEPGAGERLANIWGSGAGLVLEETNAAIGRLLKVLFSVLQYNFIWFKGSGYQTLQVCGRL